MMWPAVILAASRKDKVIGRARILTVSTSTRKGFSQSGAPPGRSPAVKVLGAYKTPDKIKENHIVNPRGNVKIK